MSQRLINLVPPYYKKSRIANGIFGTIESESDQLVDFALDVIKQGNPILATWGLSEWEKQLKLPPLPEGTPIETRRARVLALYNIPPLITPEEMEKIAGEFTRTKRATVVEYGREKRFVINIPLSDLVDLPALVDTVHEMRPKHLSFSIELGSSGTVEHITDTSDPHVFVSVHQVCGSFYSGGDWTL